jgi:molecular chaperone GrpE
MQEKKPSTHANHDIGLEPSERDVKDRALEDSPQFVDCPAEDSRTNENLGPAADLDHGDGSSGHNPGHSATTGTGANEREEADPSCGELAAQLAQEKDRALRLQAEMENLRGRTSREIAEERRYGSLPLVRDLLPVVDNIDRALQSTEDQNGTEADDPLREKQETDVGSAAIRQTAGGSTVNDTNDAAGDQSRVQESLLEGFKLVRQQLLSLLDQHHCHPIEAEGQLFDPQFHEAILQQPSDDHPAGTVLMVTQTGYIMHDRVVRAPQVIVSAGPA